MTLYDGHKYDVDDINSYNGDKNLSADDDKNKDNNNINMNCENDNITITITTTTITIAKEINIKVDGMIKTTKTTTTPLTSDPAVDKTGGGRLSGRQPSATRHA